MPTGEFPSKEKGLRQEPEPGGLLHGSQRLLLRQWQAQPPRHLALGQPSAVDSPLLTELT